MSNSFFRGLRAISFIKDNFEGHEVLTYTLDGQGGYKQSSAQIVLMNLVDRHDRAIIKGGFVTMAIHVNVPFAIYHIDSYIPEIIDADAVIEEWDNQALDAWTTYDDEPESPDYGGDE
tara:strand:- start:744 stop:1097 length:354 start_codon:yes stop_codon:yes gene_type:complete